MSVFCREREFNRYDRLGRQTSISSVTSSTLAYNDAGQLASETFTSGILAGLAITNRYDQYLRRTNVSLRNASTLLASTGYGYDNASRLQTVSDGTNTASYSYLANSPLVEQISFARSGTTRMTTTKQFDYLDRLTRISSAPSTPPPAPASSAITYNYTYSPANQRARATLADGSYWAFGYDRLGQVTSGKKHWSDGTPVAGQQFEYTFDDIGNRKTTGFGGDQNGLGLRPAAYSVNALNQYTSRSVTGAVEVVGLSYATNLVTVSGQATYRKGEYFWKELNYNNSLSPLWSNIVVAATGQATVTGNVFIARAPEVFSYDGDGNLTNDGRWVYTWDGENRLVSMTASTLAGPQQLLKFEYDSKGRRVRKQVWSNTSGSGNPANDIRFVCDGWNLVGELSSGNSVVRSYAWGLDLSGWPQGAGGVGGLLFINSPTNGMHCAAYDGNGNVSALVNASDGTLSGQYEYGPFGEVLRATGPVARANPFRFSTKYHDDETDLLYYGYRYYSASLGRWSSRDPIAEKGGRNLYGFVGGNPVCQVDRDGRTTFRRGAADRPTTCGGASVSWWFTLDNPAPCDGYFVQKVTYLTMRRTCCSDVLPPVKEDTFYEVWPAMVNSGTTGNENLFDLFMIKQQPESKGTIVILGVMRFVCASALEANCPLTWPTGPIYPGGPGSAELPRSVSMPTWWQDGFEEATHSLTSTWDCCSGTSTMSYQATP